VYCVVWYLFVCLGLFRCQKKLFFALFDAPKYARLRQIVAVHGPNVLFALVLISLLTNIDAFFFISLPSFATCNALLGENCGGLLGAIFGG